MLQKFNKSAEDVKKLKSSPSNEDLLVLYSLFKQATVGNVNTSRPGLLDMKGRAKWDAWKDREGMAQEEAKKLYVEKADSLIETIGM